MSETPTGENTWEDESEENAFLTQDDEFDEEEIEEDDAEPTGVELDGLESTADAAEAEAETDDFDEIEDEDSDDKPYVEPGAEGPEGTGVEGADDALIEDAGWDEEQDAPALDGDLDTDPITAAEQGNRDGDDMVSYGDDDSEVAELSGDDLDVDALADDGIEEVDVIDGMPETIDNAYQED